MDKAVTLKLLGEAKKAHVKWVQRAKSLIEGLPVDESAIPLNCTDCAFGQWFYGEGQKLNALGNMGSLVDIEKAHFALHDHYMKIFKIYFSDKDKSFFSKIFSSKKKISDLEKEMAKEYFIKLQASSEEVLLQIGKLERRLYAIPQSSFDASVAVSK
ncbi:MAG: CZB domain-containing protein [Sulfuricurvum sp.]|nr:CZB domain-containing protein [Sulfuricurvum sp.]